MVTFREATGPGTKHALKLKMGLKLYHICLEPLDFQAFILSLTVAVIDWLGKDPKSNKVNKP